MSGAKDNFNWVMSRFFEIVKAFPERAAISNDEYTLTYAEIDKRSRNLSERIADFGVGSRIRCWCFPKAKYRAYRLCLGNLASRWHVSPAGSRVSNEAFAVHAGRFRMPVGFDDR